MIDRDRLLTDLRAACEAAVAGCWAPTMTCRGQVCTMARAWRVIAAAIEDGEYDQAPETIERAL